jgi:hypothetical protein
MSGRTAATHNDSCAAKLLAHRRRREAQLSTDPAQRPALGVQVGCALNVHRDTVTSKCCAQPLLRSFAQHPQYFRQGVRRSPSGGVILAEDPLFAGQSVLN